VTEPALPPSRFGAGYSVGGAPAAPPARPTATTAGAAGRDGIGPPATYPALSATGMNRLAVTAFVLVLFFGPFVVLLTLPMAYIARHQINRSGQGGAGLAKAAVLIGYAYLAVGMTVLVLALYVDRSIGVALT
jgi:hypothetical protein